MSLPPVIQELVGLIGHRATMDLVHEFGGQELRIPKTEDSDTWHALAEVIGEAATRTLCAHYERGKMLYVAKCIRALAADRHRKIIARHEKLLKEGHNNRDAVSILVREFRLCYRQIEKILNRPTPEPSGVALQRQLF